MLALLAAAATLTAQPAPAVKPFTVTVLDRQHAGRVLARPLCKDAARLQTSHEPALLFREQDKADARARRLIDLPMAEACLLGAKEAAR